MQLMFLYNFGSPLVILISMSGLPLMFFLLWNSSGENMKVVGNIFLLFFVIFIMTGRVSFVQEILISSVTDFIVLRYSTRYGMGRLFHPTLLLFANFSGYYYY